MLRVDRRGLKSVSKNDVWVYLRQRYREKSGFIKSIVKETENDLIDWNSKGEDITKNEFIENEMSFELLEAW